MKGRASESQWEPRNGTASTTGKRKFTKLCFTRCSNHIYIYIYIYTHVYTTRVWRALYCVMHILTKETLCRACVVRSDYHTLLSAIIADTTDEWFPKTPPHATSVIGIPLFIPKNFRFACSTLFCPKQERVASRVFRRFRRIAMSDC